jgi:hypothetical protein
VKVDFFREYHYECYNLYLSCLEYLNIGILEYSETQNKVISSVGTGGVYLTTCPHGQALGHRVTSALCRL